MRFQKIIDKDSFFPKIEEGIKIIAGTVKRTLGPGGLPILIEREGTTAAGDPLGPMITKDGVTVASYCSHPDPEIDLVIQAVKAICSKTNRIAGDGTTTAIVLGESILMESIRELKADPNLNPQLLREAVEAASNRVITELKSQARTITTRKEIESVATISANGDAEIGRIIGEAFEKVGHEGVITVDEGHSVHTTIDVVEGFQVKRGAEAQDRFFNTSDGTRFEAENALVLLYDGKLNSYTEILPPLNAIAEVSKKGMPPVVIIANDFTPEVIQFLLIQKAEIGLKICAVKSPHTTNIRTQMLDDMAVMLAGYRFGNGNKSLTEATPQLIGACGKVIVDKYTATFYEGDGSEEQVLARVDQLKASRKSAESPYDAQLISDRIAALSQGIAKIGVGGSTDLEIKERYHRIEDALNSARAAVEEGVIPGAGIVLARIAAGYRDSQDVGEQVLSRALMAPFNQIIENIGQDSKEVAKKFMFGRNKKEHGAGSAFTYDARKKAVVDSMEAGIIDPVKVTRTALENATSIAALLSTCGGGIVFTRETK